MLSTQDLVDRQSGIGGSDVGIILGLSQFKTPFELFLEKSGKKEPDNNMSPQQEWGHRLEKVIINKFRENHKHRVLFPKSKAHPFYDFMRGNVDGYIPKTKSILEAKSSSQFMSKQWGASGSDEIPLSYLVQVAHYISIYNADQADIALLLGNCDYREFIYKRDFNIEEKVIEACKGFWHAIQNDIEPVLLTIDDLKLKYQKEIPGTKIIIDNNMAKILPEIHEVRKKIKELKEIEENYKFEIINAMADFEMLVDGDDKVVATLKANKKGNRSLLLKGI